jgi:hypothetical protein
MLPAGFLVRNGLRRRPVAQALWARFSARADRHE